MDEMDRKALGDLILVIFGVLTVLVVAVSDSVSLRMAVGSEK